MQAFVFLREFVLGNNRTGFYDGTNEVVGGENTSIYRNNILPGKSGIAVGSGTIQSTVFYPSATVAAWESFIQTAVPPQPSAGSTQNGALATLELSASTILLWGALASGLLTIL